MAAIAPARMPESHVPSKAAPGKRARSNWTSASVAWVSCKKARIVPVPLQEPGDASNRRFLHRGSTLAHPRPSTSSTPPCNHLFWPWAQTHMVVTSEMQVRNPWKQRMRLLTRYTGARWLEDKAVEGRQSLLPM